MPKEAREAIADLTSALPPDVATAVAHTADPLQMLIATAAAAVIGAITFWGSLVAFAKLRGTLSDKWSHFPGKNFINIAFGIAALALCVLLVVKPEYTWSYLAIVAVCTVLGVTLVISIGGADMPVAIALLNSYSGIAASATGFVHNTALIISGALVGASGIILTNIMCKAMNRSLVNVLIGGLSDASSKGPTADEVYGGKVKSTTAEEIAMMLDGISRFVVVPGYGMAVSQAQHAVRDLGKLLESKGVEVEYAIHPVAGRMPGHMNVLLAEADVEYEKLKTMEEINPTLSTVDVVLVIGANDVVNPDARTNPNSPIAGMPIIDVDFARTVIVVKRSLSPGYAGIPNPLFAMDNTLMYFSDGKKAIMDIVTAMKEG
jgi:NAD(P) transhydrogenase subunit beta